MRMDKLPIGIENFEEMRTLGFYYVDKTLFIRDLLNGWGKVNLFTRPRRFGKTLTMSTLKTFFEIGCNKALFDGLHIADEKQLCDEYMGKYPVVFVSLKDVDGLTFDAAQRRLIEIIREEARRLGYLLDSPLLKEYDKAALNDFLFGRVGSISLENSLKTLTELLSIHYGRQAILLIDEYDVPLDKAYQRGYYNEMIVLMRSLLGQALKTNNNILFAVLTGCLRVSKESIFTGLNNLKVHSITDEKFDEYFGFTQQEVEALMRAYALDSRIPDAKEWYDGYLFGDEHVYCPWDVINFADDLLANPAKEPKAYWVNTSGNDMVRRLIDKAGDSAAKMQIERLIDGGSMFKTLNDKLTHNEIEGNIDNLWSLMFMTGYLTTKRVSGNGVYELVIPNREVRQIYIEKVREWFKCKAKLKADSLSELFGAFEACDAPRVENILGEQLLDTISYYDAYESFYHGFLLALLGACEDWHASSNAETGRGRSDILVERKDRRRGFVIEIKEVKDKSKLGAACEAAIKQIEDNDYAAVLKRFRVSEIILYGIAFCGKECRVLAERLA